MAGSRLEKFGTVFTRVRNLMHSGVIKLPEKPIWYDVYEAFPPKRVPLHVKTHTRPCTKKRETVPEVFYKEDDIRAKFYEHYGTGPLPFDLSKSNFASTCQRFVDKYTEIKCSNELDDPAAFEETGKALLAERIVLRRRGARSVSAESRDPVLELKLTDMLAEQQSVSASSEEKMGCTMHTKAP
ncbi:small ribosomal subunit protein mS23 [Pagrus major]|uniref:small ribosomal subunit protein mS23 n=1 Tax=Pagrus major TaxID=143350 RepID=UPI003CC8A7DB